MLAHYYGLKTFYYSLINKAGAKVVEDKQVVQELETVEIDADDCESCKL
jgi:hypothetical protein